MILNNFSCFPVRHYGSDGGMLVGVCRKNIAAGRLGLILQPEGQRDAASDDELLDAQNNLRDAHDQLNPFVFVCDRDT